MKQQLESNTSSLFLSVLFFSLVAILLPKPFLGGCNFFNERWGSHCIS